MNKKLNILEAIRGGAALYVFLGHLVFGVFIAKQIQYSIF